MSFSSDVKGELARLDSENMKKCDMLAEISGFLRVSGSLTLKGDGLLGVVARTGNAAIARRFKRLMKSYFRSGVELTVGESQMPGSIKNRGRRNYNMYISPEEKSMQILRETGLMLIREGDDYFSDGIYSPIVKSRCCKKAYLRGMFLACGTISDPRKSYHLEFVIDKEQSALDLKKLIGSFVDLEANMVERGDNYIVYIKKSEYISDILGIMGADNAVLEFENIRINRGLHRDVQRLLNFDHANMDRSLTASEEQTGWVRTIIESELGRKIDPSDLTGAKLRSSGYAEEGLRHLPQPLREIAMLRLERPDANLADLGEALSVPLGKSAVSKRFAKIRAIAEKMQREDRWQT